ncbi:MAG TPA: DUF1579 family protein [Vicinamibacterales bacterium]|nr:DUF1579 family protein [Vicinamibacterales bacterium]
MSVLAQLKACTGRWTGTNRLWVDPDKPARSSDATVVVGTAGQGRFVTMAYTWADEGQPQDGLIVVGFEKDRNAVTAHWLDSWHNGVKVMRMEGTAEPGGPLFVRGTYPAPPGPDWGWTIRLEPSADRLRIVMHNIWPEGREDLAVEAVLSRS